MNRRQMIAALSGAAAWPIAARAQQAAVPVIGVLTSLSSAFMARYSPAFEDGGLMSYGIELRESWHRTADFVGKILKGAKAGDLPIEFPTKLELVINLTAARVLGLPVPPTLLARADDVIE